MGTLSLIHGLIFKLLIAAFLLRFIMQLVRANFRNEFAQLILRITSPLVLPLRRIIPGWGGLDLASLLVAYLLAVVAIITWQLISVGGIGAPGSIAWAGLWMLIGAIFNLYFVLLFVYFIASWIPDLQHHPIGALVRQMCDPLLRPARRLIPPLGGLDLSLMLVLLALILLMTVLRDFGLPL